MICDLCDSQREIIRAYRCRGHTVLMCMDCIDRIIEQYLGVRSTEGSQ